MNIIHWPVLYCFGVDMFAMGQLRRYTQAISDSERLGRESEKMNSEIAMLTSKVTELSAELSELRKQKETLEREVTNPHPVEPVRSH